MKYTDQFYRLALDEGVVYMSTTGYYWRWDADWFWCTQVFPGIGWKLVRFLIGGALLRSDVYKSFNDWVIDNVLRKFKLNKNEELVIQDIEIPIARSADYIADFLKVCPSHRIGKMRMRRQGLPEAVPMWLCPVKGTSSPLMPMDP